MSQQNESTWLTQAAYDRLRAELDELSTTGRRNIAKEIQEAREDGDLKENAGYHAAREEQGRIEARIVEIEAMLKTAVVSEAPEAAGVVELGTVVLATIAGREQKFLYADAELEAQTDLRVFSPDSPIGAAIEGMKIGESTSYLAPNGRDIPVEIIDVETFRS